MKKFKILNIIRRRKDGVKTCLYIVFIFTLFEFNGFLLNNTFIFNKRFDTILKTLKKKDKMRWDRTDRKKRLMFSIYLQTQTFFFSTWFFPDCRGEIGGALAIFLWFFKLRSGKKYINHLQFIFLNLIIKKKLRSILHFYLFCYTLLFFKFQISCDLKGHGHQ